MNKVIFRLALAIVLSAGVSGCVTTTTGGPSVDQKKALETHIRTGMTYLQQDNRDGAQRHFKKALELDDDSAEAWQGMALLHQLNGEIELAESRFKKALRGSSSISRSGIYLSYGRFLYEQERYKEAFDYIKRASEDLDYPSRSLALLYLGRTALKLDKPERAEAAFKLSATLNREQADALIELAEIYFSQRDYPQAKAYLDRFAALTRHTPRSLWLGIRIERIFGNKDKEASYALALKNMHPYSREYLQYKLLVEQ